MIRKDITHGNTVFSDGTYSRKTNYWCETIEEFVTLLKQVSDSDKSYEAKIDEKKITVQEWAQFFGSHESKFKDIFENTKLEFDDGITDEMWDAVEKAIDEMHGSEEE